MSKLEFQFKNTQRSSSYGKQRQSLLPHNSTLARLCYGKITAMPCLSQLPKEHFSTVPVFIVLSCFHLAFQPSSSFFLFNQISSLWLVMSPSAPREGLHSAHCSLTALSSPSPLQNISPSPLTRFQASLLSPSSTHNLVTWMSCLNSPELGF